MAAAKTAKARPAKAKAPEQVALPTIGRQGLNASANKCTAAAKAKQNGKANGNIMTFFGKAEATAGLFVAETSGSQPSVHDIDNKVPQAAEEDDEQEARFNESGGSTKRRRTNAGPQFDHLFGGAGEDEHNGESQSSMAKAKANANAAKSGPFFEESDSEQEKEQPEAMIAIKDESETLVPSEEQPAPAAVIDMSASSHRQQVSLNDASHDRTERPPSVKQETSYGPDPDDFKDFENVEDDFDEDPFEDGEEYRERRYMEEQSRLEEEQDEKDYDPVPPGDDSDVKQLEGDIMMAAVDAPTCPICSVSLSGVGERDAGVHVNNCLDGTPSPLPECKPEPSPQPKRKIPWSLPSESDNAAFHSQYKRPTRAPRPGQANPFEVGEPYGTSGGSAFNRLMSGHAEDAAWAAAAAEEHQSRGKPSYQRTCPFYKILPGLSICVDAFRYGAVQGCQAYFLSHFHSDHYVGLTANWFHGPIYCSKVTANLVRQQLRVDSKYVVDLEFEKTVEVPGTKGVRVTTIPANHCPGSSLYLFEKTVGKKSNGQPKLQRILHCGDFRACRAHVEHPLLIPDVQDNLTGKLREQKIDVCYLDTTYLNPKYAFPSQHNVIQACADMCVSLSKHTVDESDGWEQMKRHRAGEGMVKFIRKDSNPEIKTEPEDGEGGEDNKAGIKIIKNLDASQQLLCTRQTPSVKDGRGRLLVVVGTYSIGKERICLGIAKALKSKIYAPPSKMRIVAALEDPELNARMTNSPREAQVHMTPLFEIRAETLDDYLKDYFPHFTRAVGFRPSGWNYKPPTSRFLESPSVSTILNGDNWRSIFSMKDLVPQRGSSSRASCFGVPYSEHSSFRELTMFCCALRIERIIPTVNVGSAKSRERMKAWCERWAQERRKSGLWKVPEDGSW